MNSLNELSKIEAALKYAEMGYKIFPVREKSKDPATKNGYLDATKDKGQIVKWWKENPEYNIGLPMALNGLICIDIDKPKQGQPDYSGLDDFVELSREIGELPPHLEQITASNGYHKILKLQEGKKIIGKIGEKIDIRYNAYILVSPSVVDLSKSPPLKKPSTFPLGYYEWTTPPGQFEPSYLNEKWLQKIERVPFVPPPPPSVSQSIAGGSSYGLSALRKITSDIMRLTEPGRNQGLFPLAASAFELVHGGELEEMETWSELRGAARAIGLYEKSEMKSTEKTLNSAWRASLRNPRSRPEKQECPPQSVQPSTSIKKLHLCSYLLPGPPTATNYIIDKVLPEGVNGVVAAEMKSNKTFYVFDQAISIVTGKKFLGEFEVKKTGNVVIFSPEGNENQLKRRFWGLCAEHGLDPDEVLSHIAFIRRGLALYDESSVNLLISDLKSINPILLILDPLISATSGMDENSSKEVQPTLDKISRIKESIPGMSVLTTHHHNKANRDFEDMGKMRGSSAIGGWLDVLTTIIKDKEDQTRRIVSFTNRDEGVDPFAFHFIPSPPPLDYPHRHLTFFKLQYSELTMDDRDLLHFEDKVIWAMRTNPGSSVRDLEKISGVPKSTLHRILKSLYQDGVIKLSGNRYVIIDDHPTR